MQYYFGFNFNITDVLDQEKGTDVAMDPNALLDERTWAISANTNFSNMEWYFNYIKFTQFIAQKFPQAYPSYLLELGYVPVIYLPSPAVDAGIDKQLMERIEQKNIANVRTRPTSFVRDKVNMNTMDIWVHKLIGAEILNCRPEEVRSIALIKEVLS